jgi:hypothetical protein
VALPDLDVPGVPDVIRSRARRELAALVILLLGLGGFVTCAFVFDPLAGFATLSLLAVVVGVALGYER